jgi:hypothetical protein
MKGLGVHLCKMAPRLGQSRSVMRPLDDVFSGIALHKIEEHLQRNARSKTKQQNGSKSKVKPTCNDATPCCEVQNDCSVACGTALMAAAREERQSTKLRRRCRA